ncbi:DNA-binding response regulator [Pedobacter sp. KBW06]|uniref:LytR/AlgR family response regulator transcription factor n=1 Tax=Pedobacter sp. KBW06 TaxID=2153359 RepID=UPI000F5A3596|nr:LytTR family DNA-binding domain-containing protein [Pedobacter sp. KBW06]RQO75247.1 DNA-binding response regulator [Pedobacter sp. KBW06]
MLRCIIVDDEPNAINLLDLLITEATDWQVVARCYNGLEALQASKTQKADLIFLDINMPLLNGMELATLLPPEIKIVFTTAYSEYAAESYLLDALDYILKPVTLKRFLATQQKIESWFSNTGKQIHHKTGLPETGPIPPETSAYLFVKTGKSLQKVLLENILYIEGEKEYIRLVTIQEELLVYRRLKEVEEQLNYPFIRVHNSYIVNLEKMDKFLDNHILIGSRRIPVSNKYRIPFIAHLNNKLF